MPRHTLFNPDVLAQEFLPGRDAFYRRLRAALGRSHPPSPATPTPPAEPPPAPDPALLRQVSPDDPARIARFIARARGNSITVLPTDAANLPAALESALAAQPLSSILLNAGPFEETLRLPALLAARGLALHRWGDPNCRDTAFSVDASLTDCRCAAADTGSIMVWSDPSFGRAPTLTVPLHIVLLKASQVFPDLIDALAFLADRTAGKMPSNVVIINGPSKTSDIEMTLVTGVHGPRQLCILLIQDQ